MCVCVHVHVQHLCTLSVPGILSSCSWEGLSQRLSIASDNFVYFASVRRNYRVRSVVSLKICIISVRKFFEFEHFNYAVT